MKILIVDYRTMRTEALAIVLRNKYASSTVDVIDTGLDANSLASLNAHMILLNPYLVGIAPIEVATRIHRSSEGQTKVVFTLDRPEQRLARAAIGAKLSGVILNSDPLKELARAIDLIRAGHCYIAPALTSILYQPESDDAVFGNLTPREIAVLTLMAQGMTHKEMAISLNVSVKTVETHRQNLARKLNNPNRAQMTMFAIKHGLVSSAQLEIAA